MSHIAWHTPSGDDVLVRGWERHWFGSVVTDVASAFVPMLSQDDLIRRVVPGHWLHSEAVRGPAFGNRVRAAIGSGFEPELFIDHDGTPLKTFSLCLNTVLAVGSDALCLAARLHGQCEIHAYVEGPNRTWLADLIAQGRASGIYRAESGWEEVMDLLRAGDGEPVVTSYSVTDSFPGPPDGWRPSRMTTYDPPEPDWDEWYDLPESEQWRLALANLRSEPEKSLEMRPDNLRYPFGHERSMIDLFVASPAAVHA